MSPSPPNLSNLSPPTDISSRHSPTGLLSVVTGGAGFIGRHLVQLLLDLGHRVRVIDIQPPANVDERVEYFHGTILDLKLLKTVNEGADQVFHLAANPNLWAVDKQEFYQLNFLGTRAVLETAGQAGVKRIIHTSTESILKGRQRHDGAPVNEDVLRTVDDMPGLYCRSKFLAEQEALSAARYGLPVVIVNPTLPIGPGDYLMTPPTRMLRDFVNGKHPAYLDFDMNLIDVRDAALGHILAAERGRIGERYILGGENLRMSQVLNMVQEVTDLPMPRLRIPYALALGWAAVSEFIADNLTHRPPAASLAGVRVAGASMIFDCSKAVCELGLSPRPVRQAIADGLLFLCQQGRLHRSGLESRLHHWQFNHGR
jgi:dihydroflavonol-4-reductase